MEENRNIRINKVLRELNISLERAVDFLKDNGIFIEISPNAKINLAEYELLCNQFAGINKPKFIKEIENLSGVFLKEKIEYNSSLINNNFYKLNNRNDLIELDVFQGNISDLTFIKNHLKLRHLSLVDCKISNIELLADLSELQILHLQTNNIGDYAAIKGLNKLIELGIADNTIENFNFLPSNVENLSLKDCNIKDITFLNSSIKINSLNLSYNVIEDISSLKSLFNIKNLDLSFNKIISIQPLESFKSFQTLNLSNNLIEDISALKNIKFQGVLYLSNNNIMDLSPLYYELKRGEFFLNHFDNPTIYPPKEYERAHEIEKWKWFEEGLNLAKYRIKTAKRNKSKSLNLGSCGLTDLSLIPELFENNDHIEELIISNHYAMYDYENDFWKQEKSRGHYANNIYNIPNEIQNLKNLKILIIGGDWKQKNNSHWNRWRLKNVNFISNLKNIEIINISNNRIEELPSLNNLVNLQKIYANNNFIKKIGSFSKLGVLTELYLSNNEISDLSFLKNVNSLKTLDLHGNKIKDIEPISQLIKEIGIADSKWVINIVNIKDNLIDEAFINILKNNTDNELRKQDIFNYFKRLEQGKYVSVNRLKLILLGNTRAGKTTLADILSKEDKTINGSTHGVNFFRFTTKRVDVRGFDFGGQDYYHNTHYSFFDNNALYIIIWGNGQLNDLYTQDEEMLFPLNYWLGSLNLFVYSDIVNRFYEYLQILFLQESLEFFDKINNLLKIKKLPVFENEKTQKNIDSFLKNTSISLNNLKNIINYILEIINYNKEQKDIFTFNNYPFKSYIFQNLKENKNWLNELNLKKDYGFINDFVSYDFLNEKPKIESYLKNKIVDFSIETMKLQIDIDLSNELEKEKNKVILDISSIRKLRFEIENYSDSELESLLQSLHSILSCYYFKIDDNIKEKLKNKSLHNIVIVDIEKFTSWIYQIFDQKSKNKNFTEEDNLSSKTKEGYFTVEDVKNWLTDILAIEYVDYILAFMLQNKMIFKMKNHERFFAPNYLNESQTVTEKLFLNSFPLPIVKYIFNGHFHSSILSEIIDNYMDYLMLEDQKMKYILWKNKVLLYEDNNKSRIVYLSFDINDKNFPNISISRLDETVSDTFLLGILDFIEKIIKNYDYEKMILSKKGNYIPYKLLETHSFNEDKKRVNLFTYENVIYRRSDFKMFIDDNENYPMKKVFISYSKDDLILVNQFLDHLSSLKRDGLISTWHCTELVAGGKWDNEIQQKFEEADMICFMVSSNLLRTDYVYNYEIKKAFEKKRVNSSFKIIPIILNFCRWNTIEYNLGDFTALPYTAKPVSDFKDKNMAWYTIVECIRIMINENIQPEGDDEWFNKKELPKDIKRIYERIVKGEADNY